jgi:Leucine-rich repeat (LRR) protein
MVESQDTLDLSGLGLTSLPTELFRNDSIITSLFCSANRLTSLPDLPAALVTLYCDENQLTALPSKLPQTLERIFCQKNRLTSLPEDVPTNLRPLGISNRQMGIFRPKNISNRRI